MSFLSRFFKICAFIFLFYTGLWLIYEFTGFEFIGDLVFTPLGLIVVFCLVVGEAYFNNLSIGN